MTHVTIYTEIESSDLNTLGYDTFLNAGSPLFLIDCREDSLAPEYLQGYNNVNGNNYD